MSPVWKPSVAKGFVPFRADVCNNLSSRSSRANDDSRRARPPKLRCRSHQRISPQRRRLAVRPFRSWKAFITSTGHRRTARRDDLEVFGNFANVEIIFVHIIEQRPIHRRNTDPKIYLFALHRFERQFRIETRKQDDAVAAVKIRVHLDGLPRRVKKRQRNQTSFLFAVGKIEHRQMNLVSRRDVRHQIQMHQLRAFRLSRRPRRVKNHARIIGFRRISFKMFGFVVSDLRQRFAIFKRARRRAESIVITIKSSHESTLSKPSLTICASGSSDVPSKSNTAFASESCK
ncbi:hypothetical protein Bpfe_031256 [Biomphalaria pfeifferi]|uniref:Uncharacterized protein n=1 Tax=Biomphalaria pfeifferi TaxID=112525 RepID=A0AAD8APU4_BIOPF|nr:hypothetical protein Bpfe_031256 [Biomphalaria pfeifferi]